MKITAALLPPVAREHARPLAHAAAALGPSPRASDNSTLPAKSVEQHGQGSLRFR